MKTRVLMQIGLALLLLLGFAGGASAADKVKAVASFSILGDMVREVGGDRVEVVNLVGPDGDAHVFSPTPADAKTLASAEIFFVNGLGFEGWMERLEKSSGFKGKTVVVSQGVKPLTMQEEEGHHHGEAKGDHDHNGHAKEDQDHEEHTAADDHDEHDVTDPHAWQDLENGKVYVANIRD